MSNEPLPDRDSSFVIRHSSLGPRHSSLVKAIIPVHIGGLPAEMDAITALAARHNLAVIEDAAHAFPAAYKGRTIGSALCGQVAEPAGANRQLAQRNGQPATRSTANSPFTIRHSPFAIPHAACFSFYATKTITTGEGGMLVTDNDELANRARIMALHGISKDAWKRYTTEGSWFYEIVAPGYKYNMTDIAAAMGLAQLAKAEQMARRRREIAARYTEAFAKLPQLQTPADRDDCRHAWHLYTLRLNLEQLTIDRAQFITALKQHNIGASVHFIPLHLHPYYRETYGYRAEDFPVASREYRRVVSLPIYSKMNDTDVQDVIDAVCEVVKDGRKNSGFRIRPLFLNP